MHDPTRIPRVLDRLRDTWEGQPDLSLATLFGILANRGAGWGTTDTELEQLLIDESTSHPSHLPLTDHGRCTGDFLVETTSPDHRVTLTAAGDAVVRSMGDRDRQPSVWTYQSVRPTGPGRMLVASDDEGIEHRLGVVTLISRVVQDSTAEVAVAEAAVAEAAVGEVAVGEVAVDKVAVDSAVIDEMRRSEIGNAVWLLILEDQSRILLTHRLHMWQVDGRSVNKTTHAWEQVVRCRVGENFAYVTAGGERVELGVVDKLLLLES